MSQVKIYGLKKNIDTHKVALSHVIHKTIVDVLCFPKDKKYHRFISMSEDDMLFPDTKSEQYIIIEIMMMSGRAKETKKRLIQTLFLKIEEKIGIVKRDIEICIIESEPSNWGFSGMTGDEIQLAYEVKV